MSSHDPLDIRAEERAVEDKRLRAQLDRKTEEDDFKWLMGRRQGRRIVWRQLERAGVFKLSFSTNAMQMAFAEGNRNDGLRTLDLVHRLTPELYPVMVKENANERINADE